MIDELESFGRRLKVEVSVNSGQINGVELTTCVELEDYKNRAKSAAMLREIILLLRDALPVQELRREDQDYTKDLPEIGVGDDGKLTLTSKNLAQVKAGQEDLKKALGLTNQHVHSEIRPKPPEKL